MAFIIGLVAGYIFGKNYPPPVPEPTPAVAATAGTQPGHAYWCGQIAGEEWAQEKILGTKPPPELLECKHERELARDYEKAPNTGVVQK